MPNNKNNKSELPIIAMKDVPKPNADAKQVVALVKESGRVTGYKLADGRILGIEEGVQLAKQGGIQGVGIATRNGNEYLKSITDGSDDNNLSNLPTSTQ